MAALKQQLPKLNNLDVTQTVSLHLERRILYRVDDRNQVEKLRAHIEDVYKMAELDSSPWAAWNAEQASGTHIGEDLETD